MSNLQIKHCVTKTKNKRDIKRQNEKNLIFKRNIVIVEKKCDSDLSNCLSEEKKRIKKKNKKKNKKQCERSIKRTFVN